VDAYRELGTQTDPFDKSGEEVGLRFLWWLQEQLESLPSIVTGLMSYASLVTREGQRMPCPAKDVGTTKSSIG
jgi:hypothetical protein